MNRSSSRPFLLCPVFLFLLRGGLPFTACRMSLNFSPRTALAHAAMSNHHIFCDNQFVLA